MSPIWILLLAVLTVSDAYQPALLIANGTGLYFQNITSGLTKTVIPFSYGVTYVDYKAEKEIYAIFNSTKPEAYKIVRVQFPKNPAHNKTCSVPKNKSLSWCYLDATCGHFCEYSDFENIALIIMPKNCRFASNLVVDWKNDNIYWTCQVSNRPPQFTINSATTQGEQGRVLKKINDVKILDMKTDPYANSLFWLGKNIIEKTINVVTSNLDAENDQVIYTFYVTHGKPDPNMILEIHNQKIYLVNGQESLLRMNYDGTDRQRMDPTLLGEPLNSQLNSFTRSKLYHPLLQTPNLNCPEHRCPEICHLLTWRGVECLNSNKDLTANNDANITNSQPPTVGNTEQLSIEYTENNNHGGVTRHSSNNPNTKGMEVEVGVKNRADAEVNYTGNAESAIDVHNSSINPNPVGSEEEVGVKNGTAAEVVSSSAASSSGRMAMFLLVFVIIWSSLLLVGLVLKRKVHQGTYSPTAQEDILLALT